MPVSTDNSTTKTPILIDIDMSIDPLLAARGITQHASDYGMIRRNGYGWLYTAAPNVPGERWKAFPDQDGAKYLWKPGKPDNARFYDPRGELAQHIAAAGGVVILASGEPDVWVLWSAGIFNVTATMLGEGSIPDWFVSTLIALDVQTVRLWPDCDRAGFRHASKVAAALQDTGIAVEVYALPYPDDSKADLNILWLDCDQDSAAFVAALESCDVLELPDDPAPEMYTRVHNHDYTPPAEIETLRDQWCIDVERAAVRDWNIAPPNGKGLSRKNFSSPLRPDRRHSAQWNYAVHGFKDYGDSGEFYNTDQVADLLGYTPLWDDYKRDHAPALVKATSSKRSAPEFYEIPDPLYFPQGVPKALLYGAEGQNFNIGMQLHLNPWYHSAPRDIPSPVVFWQGYTVITELAVSGDIDPARWSIAEIADKNTRGMNYQAIRRFTEHLFSDFFLKQNTDCLGKKSENNSPGRPTTYFGLVPIKQAFTALWEYLEPLAWRALLFHEYKHIPIEAVDLHDVLDADLDTLAEVDDRCMALYAAHGDDLTAAARQFRARLDFHRRLYDPAQWLMGDYEPLSIPDGVQFPTRTAFSNAIRDYELDRFGGVYEDRYRLAAISGRSLDAHRKAGEKDGILSIPVFKEYPVPSEGHLLPQAAMLDDNALAHGRVFVRTATGEETKITPNRDWGSWLDDRGGREGAVFRVWDRTIDKRDRDDLISDQERTDKAAVSKRQGDISPTAQLDDTPAETDKPRGEFAKYKHDQGVMRCELFNVSPESDDVWGDILRRVRQQEGETVPAMHHNEPRESDLFVNEQITPAAESEATVTTVTVDHTVSIDRSIDAPRESEGKSGSDQPSEDRTASTPADQGDPSLSTVDSERINNGSPEREKAIPEPRENLSNDTTGYKPREREVVTRYDDLPNEVTEVSSEMKKLAPREREAQLSSDTTINTTRGTNRHTKMSGSPTSTLADFQVTRDQGDPSLLISDSETPASTGEVQPDGLLNEGITQPSAKLQKPMSQRRLEIPSAGLSKDTAYTPPDFSVRTEKRQHTGHTCPCGKNATALIPGAWVCDDCRQQRTAAARARLRASVADSVGVNA